MLKGISSQILSAGERVGTGKPTSMAVGSLLAIGTSHGLILVFDPSQALRWCLGSHAIGDEYGSVSAMDFNKDSTKLLAGFAKGHIILYDMTSGKMIQLINDVHPLGNAVINICFTDVCSIALCSDSGGSVFELNLKRLH